MSADEGRSMCCTWLYIEIRDELPASPDIYRRHLGIVLTIARWSLWGRRRNVDPFVSGRPLANNLTNSTIRASYLLKTLVVIVVQLRLTTLLGEQFDVSALGKSWRIPHTANT